MSNGLRRKMRQKDSKRLGKQKDACRRCSPILQEGALIDGTLRGEYGSDWLTKYGQIAPCPLCGCRLWLPIFPDWIDGDPRLQEMLRSYARLVAAKRGIPSNVFRFQFDDFVFFADPPCGCQALNEDCENHPRMAIHFEPINFSNPALSGAELAKEAAEMLRVRLRDSMVAQSGILL